MAPSPPISLASSRCNDYTIPTPIPQSQPTFSLSPHPAPVDRRPFAMTNRTHRSNEPRRASPPASGGASSSGLGRAKRTCFARGSPAAAPRRPHAPAKPTSTWRTPVRATTMAPWHATTDGHGGPPLRCSAAAGASGRAMTMAALVRFLDKPQSNLNQRPVCRTTS